MLIKLCNCDCFLLFATLIRFNYYYLQLIIAFNHLLLKPCDCNCFLLLATVITVNCYF